MTSLWRPRQVCPLSLGSSTPVRNAITLSRQLHSKHPPITRGGPMWADWANYWHSRQLLDTNSRQRLGRVTASSKVCGAEILLRCHTLLIPSLVADRLPCRALPLRVPLSIRSISIKNNYTPYWSFEHYSPSQHLSISCVHLCHQKNTINKYIFFREGGKSA